MKMWNFLQIWLLFVAILVTKVFGGGDFVQVQLSKNDENELLKTFLKAHELHIPKRRSR